MPSASSIVASLLSSPVVVRSPAVDGTLPASSRAASIKAQTFSTLMRSSGMIPPFSTRERGNRGARSLCPAQSLLRDLARDDQPLNIAGALVDLAHPHIAIDPLDREIGEIAIAAVDLDRVGGDALSHLGGEQLGHRRFLQAGLAGVAARRRVE